MAEPTTSSFGDTGTAPKKESGPGYVLMFLLLAVASSVLIAAASVSSSSSSGHSNASLKSTPHALPTCANWCPPTRIPHKADLGKLSDRLHCALRDENCATALQGPEAAKGIGGKIKKIADGTSFVFFRGTAGFFYVNLYMTPLHLLNPHAEPDFMETVPQVMSNGDTHPENFGLMSTAVKGGMVWGCNDFDQSFKSPFLLDLMRGASGFEMACVARCATKKCDCGQYSMDFAKGYLDVVEASASLRVDDLYVTGSGATKSVPMVDALFTGAGSGSAYMKKWFTKSGVDTVEQRFMAGGKLRVGVLATANDRKKWQAAVVRYLYNGPKELVELKSTDPLKFFEVLDVAEKAGSGTGSVGLVRFWVLIRGETDGWEDNHIVEFKQESDSVLERYSGMTVTSRMEGYRAAQGEQLAYPYANLFYSWAVVDGKSFLVRERSPIKDDVDISMLPLTAKGFGAYAHACGRALALFHLHAFCPDASCAPMSAPVDLDKNVAKSIRSFIAAHGRKTFESQITSFAHAEVVRTQKAHDLLRTEVEADAKLGRGPVSVLSRGPSSHCDEE